MDTQHSPIDAYIQTFPKDVQKLLEKMRKTIHAVAPEAKEIIKYGIPTFTLDGNLVHFAGYEHHIGFYPTPSAIEKFDKELSIYKRAKGSVQFPLNEPLPLELVSKIVAFRVSEVAKKVKNK